MAMTYKAHITVDKNNPYVIRWISEKEMGNLVPVIEALYYYDESTDEEIEVYPADAEVDFEVTPRNGNEYIITFKGSIELELEDEEYDALSEAGFAVDCVLVFEDEEGEMAEPDEDFEVVESPEILLAMD